MATFPPSSATLTSRTSGGIPQNEPNNLPTFIVERNLLFQTLKEKHDKVIATKARASIAVRLVTGAGDSSSELQATAWETTPGHLLKHVAKAIAAEAVVARVDGVLWDLSRPLEKDCKVSHLSYNDPDGRAVLWHSAAHVLGEAIEDHYGCLLSHGPPTTTGFFYDVTLDADRAVKETDWAPLEAKAKKYLKEKQKFDRVMVSKDDLRNLFAYSKYYLHYVERFVPDDGFTTVYRNGSLVDLCTGPHIQNTKQISAFKIKANSSAYFLNDRTRKFLQRISGVAFASAEQMKQWELFVAEAKARDHQVVGKYQKLFWFSPLSPGSAFLLPHGTRIFNAIQIMLREQYWQRDYYELRLPLIYDVQLWKTSDHWQYYQNDMFRVPLKNTPGAPLTEIDAGHKKISKTAALEDERLFALKPMNCPGHALMFASEERSYRTLPWRVADLSVLHRNKASGALSRLTRVRNFQQDHGHIFCTTDQVSSELRGMFEFMTHVYGIFGFAFKLKLSTRPEPYMGKLSEWDAAEDQLKKALQEFKGDDWILNPGDGAFYGPKIDMTVDDGMGRAFQCATIQLDFQLPQNFNLLYRTKDAAAGEHEESKLQTGNTVPVGMARPVMIHRAIVGSFERFFGVLIEHYGGKWPFWLSPRQVMVIPVMASAESYATEVKDLLRKSLLHVDTDVSGDALQKKIRAAQVAQYNFTLVVGADEIANRSVNLRNRDDVSTQQKGATIGLEQVVKKFEALRDQRRLVNAL